MPLRDRNELHLAAGYAAPYRELGLDDDDLAAVVAALERILDSHEPLPAVVMDRHWDLMRANRGAQTLFGSMIDLDALEPPINVLDLVFDADGLRPHIANWDLLAPALLARARRESVGGVPDPILAGRLDRLRKLLPSQSPVPNHAIRGPLIEVTFRVNSDIRRYFSTVTTLGTPCDITLQEVRVELFHPATEHAS